MGINKTILIVDDDDLVLESIDLLLSAVDNFQTICARGSEGAHSHMAHARHVDVIVADVILRGEISGIDVCRQVIAQCPDLAIVVITADTEVHRADIPSRGVFLRKPFGGGQLIAAVNDAIAKVSSTQVA
jgi:FixJ family two-component response regulator